MAISSTYNLNFPKNPKLHSEIINLVKNITALDRVSRCHFLYDFMPEFTIRKTHETIDKDHFVREIIPFLSLMDGKSYNQALIPLERVLGQSWKRQPKDYIRNDGGIEKTKIAAQSLYDRGADKGPDKAIVTAIYPLGLCYADEGKNRIAYFRKLGYPDILAKVYVIDYPAPERLKLYRIPMDNGNKIWCVLDGRIAKPLTFDRLTERLFSAYGVEKTTDWPASLPHKKMVLEAWRENSPSVFENRQDVIDLEEIRARCESKKNSLSSGKTNIINFVMNSISNNTIEMHWRNFGVALIALSLIVFLDQFSIFPQWLCTQVAPLIFLASIILVAPILKAPQQPTV